VDESNNHHQTHSSAEEAHTMLSKNAIRKKLLIFLLLTFLSLVVVSFIFLAVSYKDNRYHFFGPTTKSAISPKENPLLVEELNISNVLIDHVPNFDNLDLKDLPQINPSGSIYTNAAFMYDGNILIVDQGVIEYDLKKKQIIRMNDTSKFNCVNTSILIKDMLYIFCHGNFSPGDNYLQKRGVYVLDLKKNAITKAYYDRFGSNNNLEGGDLSMLFNQTKQQTDLPVFINVSLGYYGGMLWLGTRNGVVRVNPSNDQMKFYHASELGQNLRSPCPDVDIRTNKNFLWSWNTANDCSSAFISIYNTAQDKWILFNEAEIFSDQLLTDSPSSTFFEKLKIAYSNTDLFVLRETPSKKIQIATYNFQHNTWSVEAKPFSQALDKSLYVPYISNTLLNEYGGGEKVISHFDYRDNLQKINISISYLGISNKISNKYYLVASDGIYILEANSFPKKLFSIPSSYTNMEDTFVDKNENNLFFIEISPGMIDTYVSFDLINLKTGQRTVLLERRSVDGTKVPKSITMLLNDLADATRIETETGVKFIKKNSSEELLEVNFVTNEVKFREQKQ